MRKTRAPREGEPKSVLIQVRKMTSTHLYRKQNLWFYALASTLGISVAPFVILFFINVDNSEEKRGWLKVLLGFASGGLLGDAFLHLIPHAIMAQEGGHGHSHGGGHGHSHGGGHGHSHGGDGDEGHSHDLTVGLGVLGGILAFMTVEKVVRIVSGGGSHGHSHGPPAKEAKKGADKKEEPKKGKKKDKDSDAEEEQKEDAKDKKGKKAADVRTPPEDDGKEIDVTGYLNLFADGFHNFTDGLAIGTSYLAGENWKK